MPTRRSHAVAQVLTAAPLLVRCMVQTARPAGSMRTGRGGEGLRNVDACKGVRALGAAVQALQRSVEQAEGQGPVWRARLWPVRCTGEPGAAAWAETCLPGRHGQLVCQPQERGLVTRSARAHLRLHHRHVQVPPEQQHGVSRVDAPHQVLPPPPGRRARGGRGAWAATVALTLGGAGSQCTCACRLVGCGPARAEQAMCVSVALRWAVAGLAAGASMMILPKQWHGAPQASSAAATHWTA